MMRLYAAQYPERHIAEGSKASKQLYIQLRNNVVDKIWYVEY